MSEVTQRPLGLAGLGPIDAPADALGDRWFDADRARVIDADTLAPWPGWRRRGTVLFDAATQGAAGNHLQVTRFPATWLDREGGHGLAVVDRSANTAGRVLALAHQEGGRFANLIGVADAAGLETGGAPIVSAPLAFTVKIVSTPGINEVDTFTWSIDGGDTWYSGGAGIDITGDWQTIGQGYGTGILIKFAATTGHEVGDAWNFSTGETPHLAATLNRQGPHQYPSIVQSRGKSFIYDAWNPVMVDDGVTVRRAGIERPKLRPIIVGYEDGETLTGETDADPVAWVAVDAAVTVSRETTTKQEGTASVKLVLDDALAGKRAWPIARLVTSGLIPAGTVKMTMWYYGEISTDPGTRYILPKNLELVFAENADGTGKKFSCPCWDTSLSQNAWDQLTFGLPGFEFYYRSVTLQIGYPLTAAQFSLAGGKVNWYLDTMALVAPETPTEELAGVQGEWAFCFTWYDRERMAESAPSPYTPLQRIDGSVRPTLDLRGTNALTAAIAGLANAAPTGVDCVQVYVANTLWDVDPRREGLSFYRVTPDEGVLISSLTNLNISLADYAYSVERTPASGARHPYYNDPPVPGALAIEDGRLIVSAIRPAYRVGTWNRTNDSHEITPVTATTATTPVVNDWMVGRRCRFLDDDRVYSIVKATTAGLFIAGGFDPVTQDYEVPYQGTTGTGILEILADSSSIAWTNNTSAAGVDAEASDTLNRLEVLPGDEIMGGGKVGEFLWLVGRRGAAVVRQEPGELTDLPGAAPYANPVYLDGVSLIGRRAWVSLPEGGAMIVTQQGELAVLSGLSARLHPASPALASFLKGYAKLVAPADLEQIHASYHSTTDGKFLLLTLPGPAGTVGALGLRGRSADTWDLVTDTQSLAAMGDTVNVSALARDYEFGVMVDLRRGIVLPATECRFTCIDGEFGGDRNGFVAQMFPALWQSWGAPDEKFIFTAILSGETVVLDATLTVNQLVGLIVAKRTGTAVEYRRIASNTANTITPSVAWTTDLAVGDLVYVGPLPWMVHFAEQRAARPFAPLALWGDYETATTQTAAGVTASPAAIATIETFGAVGAGRRVDDLTADQSLTVLASTWAAGLGRIWLASLARKALSYRLTILSGQNGPGRVRNLAVEERTR